MGCSDAALASLDAAGAEFDFPVLDNAFWNFGAGRIRGFRRDSDWALVFEIFVYQTQAYEFSTQVYGYGPLLGSRQGFLDSVTVLQEEPTAPLWDERGAWNDAGHRTVIINGEPFLVVSDDCTAVAPHATAHETLLLSHGDDLSEGAFARALVRELGIKRLIPERVIFGLLPELQDAAEIVRLANWDHPDIAGGERPSQSHALRSTLKVLCGEALALNYEHDRDNVSWEKWLLYPR